MLQPQRTNALSTEPARLRDAWNLIRNLRPTAPQRQIAEDLGVTEAQLVAAHCGDTAVRLRPHWAALLTDLAQLGDVQALTRNDDAVIEVDGVFRNVVARDGTVSVRDRDIDLEFDTTEWSCAFAVRELTRQGVRCSLQFFDRAGASAHKVFLRPHSAECAFDAIARLYADEDQSPVAPAPDADYQRDPTRAPHVDVGELRGRWSRLATFDASDVLLADLGVDRIRALRLLGEPQARRAPNSALLRALEMASVRYVSIGASVANPAAHQRFTGTVLNVKPLAGWINVLDDTFNFHVRAGAIAETWVVSIPGVDEPQVSIETYDHEGELVATAFGAPAVSPFENERWLAITDELAM